MDPETCPNCGELLNEPAYFDAFSDVIGNHVIVGGRVVGKTELLVRRTVDFFEDGESIAIIAPRMRMCRLLRDRVVEDIGVNSLTHSHGDRVETATGGDVEFYSSASMHGVMESRIEQFDAVFVDEAQNVSKSVWLGLDRISDQIETLVFAGTPTPSQGILGGFAEYNTKYETWHIPATSDESIVSDEKVEQQYEYMTGRQFAAEIEAEYWSGDSPTIPADHDYS